MITGRQPPNRAVETPQFPVFEMTEKDKDGGRYFIANAAGLVAMRNLLDRMIDGVEAASREGTIDPLSMLRMQTSRHITAPTKTDPWNTPACYLAVALTNPSDLLARIEDRDPGIQQA